MSDNAIIPRTVEEASQLSTRFAKSALLPPDLRGKEADVLVTILAGQELGLPPMAALRGIHVVKGRPILSADTMVGVVLGRAVAEYFVCTEESDTSATYETKRVGSPKSQRCTWTIQDAQRAGLSGDNWKKYPRAMLKARCKAMLARDVYPDVLAGCYETSEASEVAGHEVARPAPAPLPAKVEPVAIDAEVVEEYDLDGAITAMRECETPEDLNQLGAGFRDAPAAAREKLKSEFRKLMTQLRAAQAPAPAEAA